MRRYISIIFIICVVACFAGINHYSASAAESNWMPDLDYSQKGNLAVDLYYTNENKEKDYISGVGFKLYKVADVSVSDGEVTYTTIDPFKSVDVDYSQMTAKSSLDTASEMSRLVSGAEGIEVITDGAGKVLFSNLDFGMYMLMQTTTNKNYTTMKPFLIQVPQVELSEEGNSWVYNIMATPKVGMREKAPDYHNKDPEPEDEDDTTTTEVKKEKPKSDSELRTGDDMPLRFYVTIALIAMLGICCAVVSKITRGRAKSR